MRKTFKRSLACLLAILMVAFSMPFSVSAAQIERQWWIEDGLDPKYDEENGYYILDIDDEPVYDGANSDAMGMGYEFSYSFDPNDAWYGGGLEEYDARDVSKPILAVIVSSQGSDTEGTYINSRGIEKEKWDNALANQYYSYSASYDYETVKQAGNIVNPADLKKGQRIAITLEWGGFDQFDAGQILCKYDTEFLSSGKYQGNPSELNGDTWKTQTSATGGQLNNSGKYYSDAMSNGLTNIDTSSGDIIVANISTNVSALSLYPKFIGTGNTDRDPSGGRPFGKYGILFVTLSFEVLKDCDLTEVFTFYNHPGDTFVQLINPELDLTGPFKVALSGNSETCAIAPVVFDSYEEVTTPSHTHEYGTPSYEWAEDDSTCTATMTCDTCEEGTENKTVTETVESQYTVVEAATCEATGTGKYTATFTNNAFEAQEKEVTIPVTDHTYGDTYAPVTDKTHALVCTVCDEPDTTNAVACDFEYEVTTPATCTTAGLGTYTCAACGNSYTEEIPATGHTANYAAAEYRWTGNDTDGYTACVAVIPCSECGTLEAFTVDGVVAATSDDASCTVAGKTTYTATFDNENLVTQTKVVTGTTLPHDYDYANADYTWEGTTSCTAVAKCKNCDATVDATTTNITSEVTVEPTCQTMGTTTYTATFEAPFGTATTTAQDVPTVGHNMVEVPDSAVEATVDNAGKYADKECSFGCGTTETGAEISQVAHYTVTATAENGTAKVDGVSPLNNVVVNGNITLTATPAEEGLEFVGWSLNDKIVSTDLVYTTKAIADAAYVAIFKEAETSEFTVVFTDVYGNVYSSQTVPSASEIKVPDSPELVGFTFKGWSMSEEDILKLTSGATIMAIFERTKEESYTVTVPGDCTIVGVEGETTTTVDYNTLVKVNAPAGATNGTWKINGAEVAYGTSYEFFVGSDVTLTFEASDVVNAVPTVAMVSVTKEEGSNRVAFLATRSVTNGYTYVNAGFVYGKDLDADDLTLANVGSDEVTVYDAYCSTGSDQFRLTCGIASGTGIASAKAFLAYVDSSGNTHVRYSEPLSYDYDAQA